VIEKTGFLTSRRGSHCPGLERIEEAIYWLSTKNEAASVSGLIITLATILVANDKLCVL
jgi:hypothetical protein